MYPNIIYNSKKSFFYSVIKTAVKIFFIGSSWYALTNANKYIIYIDGWSILFYFPPKQRASSQEQIKAIWSPDAHKNLISAIFVFFSDVFIKAHFL